MIFCDVINPEVRNLLLKYLPQSLRDADVQLNPDNTIEAVHGGKKVVSVFPSATVDGPSHETQEQAFDYYTGFNVGITYRHMNVAPDRIFTQLMSKFDGPIAMARNITGILRKFRCELLTNVNTAFDATETGYKLIVPFRRITPAVEYIKVGEDHLNADPDLDVSGRLLSRERWALHTSIEYGLGRVMVTFDDMMVGEDPPTPPETESAFTTGFSLGFRS